MRFLGYSVSLGRKTGVRTPESEADTHRSTVPLSLSVTATPRAWDSWARSLRGRMWEWVPANGLISLRRRWIRAGHLKSTMSADENVTLARLARLARGASPRCKVEYATRCPSQKNSANARYLNGAGIGKRCVPYYCRYYLYEIYTDPLVAQMATRKWRRFRFRSRRRGDRAPRRKTTWWIFMRRARILSNQNVRLDYILKSSTSNSIRFNCFIILMIFTAFYVLQYNYKEITNCAK